MKFDVDNVVVIGGVGVFGCVFVSLFEWSNYNVLVVEKDDWESGRVILLLSCVLLVVVVVFINLIEVVISKFIMLLEDCVFVDIISIKVKLFEVMFVVYNGLVVGLYFMFGFDVFGMIK